MEKYIITNNFSKLYNTREEAQVEYNSILSELSELDKIAFKFLYTIAPFYIHEK